MEKTNETLDKKMTCACGHEKKAHICEIIKYKENIKQLISKTGCMSCNCRKFKE